MKFVEEQTFKQSIGIYKIVNLITGGVYIGQTRDGFQRRYWFHAWELNHGTHSNKHLQKSWCKYGGSAFEFRVLEVCESDNIDQREIYWIKTARESGLCYNIQDGGQPDCLCRYVTKESRQRVGEINRKIRTGTKASLETREKMSKSRKGVRHPRKNDSLSDDQAITVKTMFVSGCSSREIMDKTGIPYKPINAILSNNAYSTIPVPGWDEFRDNHLREILFRKDRGVKIVGDIQSGMTLREVSEKYGLNIKTIAYYQRKMEQKDNPVPSLSNEKG